MEWRKTSFRIVFSQTTSQPSAQHNAAQIADNSGRSPVVVTDGLLAVRHRLSADLWLALRFGGHDKR